MASITLEHSNKLYEIATFLGEQLDQDPFNQVLIDNYVRVMHAWATVELARNNK